MGKSVQIKLTCKEEEAARIREYAKRHSLSLSAFMVSSALASIDAETLLPDMQTLLNGYAAALNALLLGSESMPDISDRLSAVQAEYQRIQGRMSPELRASLPVVEV